MLVIHGVRLKDYASFKDVQFKIKPGITAIYGLNRSGGKASKNSNGVGKSALAYSIPEIIYEEPIVGEKQDRSKLGEKGISFSTSKGKRVIVQRRAKGRSESIEIKVDGVPQQFRTSSIAKSFLRKAWPITQDEYSTYVHIDSRVPHPLVMGNSAQRKSFFTSFFGLDKIDIERKLYTAELSKLKRVRAAFDELRVQYDRLKDQLLTDEQVEKYTRLERKYKRLVASLQQEFTSVQDTLRLIQFAESSVEQIKELKNACHGTVSVDEFEEAEKQNQWELKDALNKLENAEQWEQYQRDNKHYTEAFNKLSTRTRKLIEKYGTSKLRKKAGGYADLRMHVSVVVNNAENWIQKLEKCIALPLPRKVTAPEEDEGDLETLRRAYKHQLEHASKFKKGTCETCGQVVKIKDPQVLREKLEAVVLKLNRVKKAELYTEAVAKRRQDRIDLEKWKTDYKKDKIEEDRLSKWEAVMEELVNLPAKPKAFEGLKLQVVVCKRMVEEIRERKSLLSYMQPHLDTVIDFLKLTKAEVKEARQSEGINDQMNDLQTKWSRIQAKLEIHKTLKEQVQDMRVRLLAMKKKLAEEEPLKHLVQGYQDKNIKKMAVEAISERLMVLVNRYAQKILPERFTFEFKWDTQIQLIVHRHHGKHVRSSDVRKLSGAESTLFTLILVCALLAFVPSHKRCNVLILDEPAARLSKELQEVFKNMLTILNQLIPSIIVITPHDELYEGASCYTVCKDSSGNSTVVDGSPHQIK